MSNIITEGLLEITKRVKLFLNLDDDSRINNFYLKQKTQLNKDIKALNKNLDTLKDNYDEQVEDLNEKLEDAKIRVNEAYEGVKPEDVSTNEKASQFAETYWFKVEIAEQAVSELESELEDAIETYEDDKKEIEEEIVERQRRLAKLA